jgi:hypothetical protein
LTRTRPHATSGPSERASRPTSHRRGRLARDLPIDGPAPLAAKPSETPGSTLFGGGLDDPLRLVHLGRHLPGPAALVYLVATPAAFGLRAVAPLWPSRPLVPERGGGGKAAAWSGTPRVGGDVARRRSCSSRFSGRDAGAPGRRRGPLGTRWGRPAARLTGTPGPDRLSHPAGPSRAGGTGSAREPSHPPQRDATARRPEGLRRRGEPEQGGPSHAR